MAFLGYHHEYGACSGGHVIIYGVYRITTNIQGVSHEEFMEPYVDQKIAEYDMQERNEQERRQGTDKFFQYIVKPLTLNTQSSLIREHEKHVELDFEFPSEVTEAILFFRRNFRRVETEGAVGRKFWEETLYPFMALSQKNAKALMHALPPGFTRFQVMDYLAQQEEEKT